MKIAEEMNARLTAAFATRVLKITDDSESHRGHAGFREGGQSHFEIEIAAEIFGTMSRVERYRAVHAALGRDLVASIHALALKISD